MSSSFVVKRVVVFAMVTTTFLLPRIDAWITTSTTPAFASRKAKDSSLSPLYYTFDSNVDDNEKNIDGIDDDSRGRVLDIIRSSRLDLNPRLTTMARERLVAEIELLKSLEDSNDAVMELTNIWNSGGYGGGAKSFTSMMNIEMAISMGHAMGGDKWERAELQLEGMILEHDMKWIEPIHKLGYLYQMQDRLEDAQVIYQYVLDHKPWHIGAIHGMVSTHSKLDNADEVNHWLTKELPPLRKSTSTMEEEDQVRCRKNWVNEMVEIASKQLSGEYIAPSAKDKFLSSLSKDATSDNGAVSTLLDVIDVADEELEECWQ